MKKLRPKIIACIFIMSIIITSLQPYAATMSEEGRVVRVGFYHMDGFSYYDQYGEEQGYCIDYLNMLASFTGWKYEYVSVNDFGDGCKRLEAKEIDLLAPAMKTRERQAMFEYSELEFGTEYTIMVTKDDRDDLCYEDYEQFTDMRVAVLLNYPLTEYYLKYMENYNFSSNLVYYQSIDQSKAALEAGEVEAIVTSIMDMEENQKLLARFAPQPFYFLTWKGNTNFLNTLNRAMEQVQNTYPTYLDTLLKTHYPVYNLQFFSREEIEFVEQTKPLRVAYISDRKPLSFTNEKGELDGISRAIFDEISRISGLKFEYIPLPMGKITYETMQDMHVDLVSGVEYNNTNVNASGILLTTPYLASRKMIVSSADFVYDPELPYRLAVAKGSQTLNEVLRNSYPNMNIINYDTNEDCFEALADGEVDMLIQNQFVVESVLSKPRYQEFVVAPMEGLADELCFSTIVGLNGGYGMSEQESIKLVTILNKAISQIKEQDIDNMIVRETLENQYEIDYRDFFYMYRWTIATLVVVLISICIFVGISMQSRKRRMQMLQEEHRRMSLQEKRYKTIMDCSEDLIYEFSIVGGQNLGSERFKDKFGWEIPSCVEELTFDKTMGILHVHPEDTDKFRNNLLEEGRGGSDELTVRLQKTDGEYIWCKVFRTLLMDDGGRPVSVLGKIEDVDIEVKERQALEVSSRMDALSGLLNKATFKREVKDYLADNSARNVGFVFMDMDHFKDINDHLGHRTGDIVIKENAKKIQLLFANFDLVSRFGGDEFCIFVKDIPRQTLEDRLAFAVEKMRKDYPYDGGVIHLSASIGAAYCKCDTVEYKDLFEVADTALYKVKDQGRDNYLIVDID